MASARGGLRDFHLAVVEQNVLVVLEPVAVGFHLLVEMYREGEASQERYYNAYEDISERYFPYHNFIFLCIRRCR